MQRGAARLALIVSVAMLAAVTPLFGSFSSAAAPAAPAQTELCTILPDPPEGLCPTPTPSGSASASASASASSSPSSSPSSSASASASSSPSGSPGCGAPSGSPSASPSSSPSCASGSPSASRSATVSSSPSGTATRSPRSISLGASKGEVDSGAEVDFAGQLFSTSSNCDGFEEFVRLRRRVAGDSEFQNFKTTLTDANGRFEFNAVEIVYNAEYVAFAPGHDTCDDAVSDPVRVLARGRVSLRAADKTPERGSLVRLKGNVRPRHPGTKLRLQQRRGGGWETVAGGTLGRTSRFVFEFEATGPKSQRYRVHWLGSKDNEPATSKEIKLSLHK